MRGGTVGAALTAVLVVSGCGGGGGQSAAKTQLTKRTLPPETTGVPFANQRFRPAPPAQQTSPSISPASGTAKTTFVLSLTARSRLGVAGHVRNDYRVLLKGPHPRCAQFTEITIGALGARLHKSLIAPYYLGWCRGSYRGVVILDTNPVCNPTPGSPPCVLFATRSLDVGHFTFTIG